MEKKLVTPAASDSWNCLSEIEGQELMAQQSSESVRGGVIIGLGSWL